jgi:hypothetical protein
MEQRLLFEVARPPSEDELGDALLWGARMAVHKRLLGDPPRGVEREDLVGILIQRSLRVCSRWRPGGKKTLREYCYMKSCFELCEVLAALTHTPEMDLDALDALSTASLDGARLNPAYQPPPPGYDDVEERRVYWQRALDGLRAILEAVADAA